MERLTENWDEFNTPIMVCEEFNKECPYDDCPLFDCKWYQKAVEKLYKYEETGLEPEQVQKLKEQTDWIPVEERLPNHDNCVLMCSHRGGMDVGWYDGKRWRTGYSHADVVNDIIAWCPLPDPYHSELN